MAYIDLIINRLWESTGSMCSQVDPQNPHGSKRFWNHVHEAPRIGRWTVEAGALGKARMAPPSVSRCHSSAEKNTFASRRVWGLRLRRTERRLAIAPPARVAFRQCKSVGVLFASFRSSIPSPPVPLFTLRRTPRGAQRKTRGRVVRYSFLVGLLHSLLHAGLSRRTDLAIMRHPKPPEFQKVT